VVAGGGASYYYGTVVVCVLGAAWWQNKTHASLTKIFLGADAPVNWLPGTRKAGMGVRATTEIGLAP